jgi:hypothetical protein
LIAAKAPIVDFSSSSSSVPMPTCSFTNSGAPGRLRLVGAGERIEHDWVVLVLP